MRTLVTKKLWRLEGLYPSSGVGNADRFAEKFAEKLDAAIPTPLYYWDCETNSSDF